MDPITTSASPTQPNISPTYAPSIDCYDQQENFNSPMQFVHFESRVKMDNWSVLYDETHWKLTSYSNDAAYEPETVYFYQTSGFYNDLEIVVTKACLPVNKIGSDCFVFELSDDYGDGLSQTGNDDNYWIMLLRENHDYDFVYPWEHEHYLWMKQGQFKSSMNRDAYYLRINFCLSDDDIGITASPSPSPTHIPTPLPTHTMCNQSYALFTLRIELDYWAVTYNETYWSLTKVDSYNYNINTTSIETTSDAAYVLNDYGALYANQWKLNDTVAEYEICLPIASDDCYQFKITDTFGDGLDDAGSGDGDNIWLYLDSHLIDKQSWRHGQTMMSRFCMIDYYTFMPTPSPSISYNQEAISSSNGNNNSNSDIHTFIVSFIATLCAVIVIGIIVGIVYMYRVGYQIKKVKNTNNATIRRKLVEKNVSIQSDVISSVEMGAIENKNDDEQDIDNSTHVSAYEQTNGVIVTSGHIDQDIDGEDIDVQDIQPPMRIKKSQDGIGMYESIGL